MKPTLKNKNNTYIINGLFYELQHKANDDVTPLFSLKENDIIRDGVKYPSLKRIYMSYNHVPGLEYEFAIDVFREWEHWERICNGFHTKEHVQQWRDELTVRLKAEAIKSMVDISKGDSGSAAQAAKYIASLGWEVKAGRPTKEEKTRQAKIAAGVNETLKEDMDRLGLSVVGEK